MKVLRLEREQLTDRQQENPGIYVMSITLCIFYQPVYTSMGTLCVLSYSSSVVPHPPILRTFSVFFQFTIPPSHTPTFSVFFQYTPILFFQYTIPPSHLGHFLFSSSIHFLYTIPPSQIHVHTIWHFLYSSGILFHPPILTTFSVPPSHT